MKRTEILEEYWEEFLQDCHYSLVTHGANDSYERSKAEPTESNFWSWYMKNKMIQNEARINEQLERQKPAAS